MRNIMNVALFSGILSLAGILPAAAAAPPAAQQSPAMAQGGEQTCLTCHGTDPKVIAILQSPMAMKGDPRTPFAQGGCQTCHGDSLDHIAMKKPFPDVVFSGKNASPVAVRNQVCLSCHQAGLRMNWQGSQMQQAGLACADCHTAHAAKDPVLVRATQPEKCFTCHADVRADTLKYSHHPIREGKVVCSDCHNPHGSPGPHLLKEFTVNETCYTCHADKRGPMLWEHQPVRDDCTNCHTPHGSNQPRLLKEPLNFLCSSCHSSEGNSSGGAFGGAHSVPFRGPGTGNFNSALANQRQCLNCHSQVHGSNSPSGAFFLR
jgi:DmsE family decaheme c-type cytochrome